MYSAQTDTGDHDGPILQDLLLDIAGHRYLILLFFLSTTVGTYITLQLVTPQYESHASLLVKLGRENLEVPSTVDKGGVFSTGVRAEEINSEIGLLTSRGLAEATVDKMGLEAFREHPQVPQTLFEAVKYRVKRVARWFKDGFRSLLVSANLAQELSERDKAVVGVSGALKVERQKESDVIALTVRLPDPQLAMRVLETLLALYRERHIAVRRNPPMQEFYAAQAASFEEEIRKIESSKERLRSDRKVSSVDQQRRQLVERLHNILQRQEDYRSQLVLLGKVDGTTGTPASPSTPSAGTPEVAASDVAHVAIAPMTERIAQLRIERAKLAPGSPLARDVDEEIAGIEQSLSRSLKASIAELGAQANALRNELVSLNSTERRLADYERELKVNEDNYAAYGKRMEEARVSEELDMRRVLNVSELDPPSRPIEPVSPRKLFVMGVSIPLGLILGIAVALLLEYLNNTVRTYRDLTSIKGLTYLGTFRLSPAGRPGELAKR